MTLTPAPPSTLSGCCDACGVTVPVYQLHLVLVQEKQSVDPRWNLICSVCFVDGPS